MVAPLVVGAAIGAGLALMKNREEQMQANRDRKMKAALMRQSPWTGMQVDPMVRDPSLAGNLLQGGATGAMMGQSFGNTAPLGGGAAGGSAGGAAGAAAAQQGPPQQGFMWNDPYWNRYSTTA